MRSRLGVSYRLDFKPCQWGSDLYLRHFSIRELDHVGYANDKFQFFGLLSGLGPVRLAVI